MSDVDRSIRQSVMVGLVAVVATSLASASPRTGRVETIVREPAAVRPTLGPRYAPVTIEYFVDPRKSSKTYWTYKNLSELAERHPTRLRILFRFPFTDNFSNAARVAFRYGRFEELAARLFGQRFHRYRDLDDIVEDLGFDSESFKAEIEARHHQAAALADRAYARRWGLRLVSSSRPGLLVNGEPFRGRSSLDALEKAYDGAYRQASALLAAGVPKHRLYRKLLSEQVQQRGVVELPIGRVDGGAVESQEREEHPALAGPIDFSVAHLDGPGDAPVTVSWFCSLQSQPCASLYRSIRGARDSFPSEVRLAFFHAYQGDDEGQPAARMLHLGALCAAEQGDIWSYLDKVYQRYRPGELDPGYLETLATDAGLDADKLMRCTTAPATDRRLRRAIEVARKARVRRTPSVVVGGLIYLGSRDFHQLARLIEANLHGGVLGRFIWPN